MHFLWPNALWLLLIVPLLIGVYLSLLRQRKKTAVPYASLSLVRPAIGPRQHLRRHLPPAFFGLALTAALFAVARPIATVSLPSEYMTLVLSMDVSRSMYASDIDPTRIVAAQTAAKSFIQDLPQHVRLAITSFAGTAAVVQTPTENRQDMLAAIDRLQLQRGTATGSGLLVSLAILFPNDPDIDLDTASLDDSSSRSSGITPFNRAGKQTQKPSNATLAPVAAGSYTAGTILLLSDGRRTTGPDPIEAAHLAANRGVRVYTVGFGNSEATKTLDASKAATNAPNSWAYYVRLDEETLKNIAQITGGEYFHASSANDLKKVYEKLNLKLTIERRETEIGALFTAIAVALMIVALGLSLRWFRQLH